MTRIEAIIRPERLELVREALLSTGADGMTVLECKGHGRQKGHSLTYRGAEYAVELREKIKLEMVVHDGDLDDVVRAICSAARTGSIGDGKIFLMRVEEAVRIRDGSINEAAI